MESVVVEHGGGGDDGAKLQSVAVKAKAQNGSSSIGCNIIVLPCFSSVFR